MNFKVGDKVYHRSNRYLYDTDKKYGIILSMIVPELSGAILVQWDDTSKSKVFLSSILPSKETIRNNKLQQLGI